VRYTKDHLLDSRKINKKHRVVFFPCRDSPLVGLSLLIVEISQSNSDTPHTVRLLWTSDQSDAEISTYTQYLKRYPFPRWDSNPQSLPASGLRPTP